MVSIQCLPFRLRSTTLMKCVLYQFCLESLVLLLLLLKLFGQSAQCLVSSLPQTLLLIIAGLQVCQNKPFLVVNTIIFKITQIPHLLTHVRKKHISRKCKTLHRVCKTKCWINYFRRNTMDGLSRYNSGLVKEFFSVVGWCRFGDTGLSVFWRHTNLLSLWPAAQPSAQTGLSSAWCWTFLSLLRSASFQALRKEHQI